MINKKVSTIAGSLIILAIAIALGFIFFSNEEKETQNQNNVVLDNSDLGNREEVKQEKEKIAEDIKNGADEKEIIMENVSFCGKIYKSEKVIINNINIAESLAKISDKKIMCRNMELGKFQESGIEIFQKKEDSKNNSYLIVFVHPDNQKEKDDPLNQSPYIFRFDFNNNKVYFQSQIDAKFNYIGDIK